MFILYLSDLDRKEDSDAVLAEVISSFINLFLQLFRMNDNRMAMKIWKTEEGRTKTLYTWGRGTQVKTVKN